MIEKGQPGGGQFDAVYAAARHAGTGQR
jgi:hypothetical protein